MSGYVEIKIRTTSSLGGKLLDAVIEETARVLKHSGFTGSIKCTNTGKQVVFEHEPQVAKMQLPPTHVQTDIEDFLGGGTATPVEGDTD